VWLKRQPVGSWASQQGLSRTGGVRGCVTSGKATPTLLANMLLPRRNGIPCMRLALTRGL